MRWVFFVALSALIFTGVLFTSPAAEAGKGALLTGQELGHVFGGKASGCGSVKREACVPQKKEGPVSEIILWDEWINRPGRPHHFTPGGHWNSGNSKVTFHSNIRTRN